LRLDLVDRRINDSYKPKQPRLSNNLDLIDLTFFYQDLGGACMKFDLGRDTRFTAVPIPFFQWSKKFFYTLLRVKRTMGVGAVGSCLTSRLHPSAAIQTKYNDRMPVRVAERKWQLVDRVVATTRLCRCHRMPLAEPHSPNQAYYYDSPLQYRPTSPYSKTYLW
jgi:hypothetical protein